jgi:hypothetical protein
MYAITSASATAAQNSVGLFMFVLDGYEAYYYTVFYVRVNPTIRVK